MDRYTLPSTAIEITTGDFIDIAAVETLLENQIVLARAKGEFQGALRILQKREELTVVTILNLAGSIGKAIYAPELVGKRYEIGAQSARRSADGRVVRIQDAEHLRDACLSLFDECEALQDAVRSEIHKSRHAYVFTWRGTPR
ncbi:hypothetical protein [Paraburkholderia sp. BCC1876]|jgi:hypothetical protein|uniref:hypothetical protein n=1 Tax=Paraburkholderia sp. BCC1876 TaxID=2676303 RepID=UPI0015922E17|nr:hypothetical protein [Paraburkholderia sp. BCC1876]